jgi:solute carrier family 25 (mitochondrial carnitine/acylcarnitine transporter), member 20/29
MASPLLGIAGVNSLLFAAYGASKRIVSPFPELSLQQTALAGSMAGAANAILASPGWTVIRLLVAIQLIFILSGDV